MNHKIDIQALAEGGKTTELEALLILIRCQRFLPSRFRAWLTVLTSLNVQPA